MSTNCVSCITLLFLIRQPTFLGDGDTPPLCKKADYTFPVGPDAQTLSANHSMAVEAWIFEAVRENYTKPANVAFGYNAMLANDRKLLNVLISQFGLQDKDQPIYFVHGGTWCHDPREFDFNVDSHTHKPLLYTVSFVDKAQNLFWPTTSAIGYEIANSDDLPISRLENFSNRTIGFFSIWKRTKACSFVASRDDIHTNSIPDSDEHVYVRTHYDYTKLATQMYQWPDSYVFTPHAKLACGLQLEHVYAIRLPLPSELRKNDTLVRLWDVTQDCKEFSMTVAAKVLSTFSNAQTLFLCSVCVLFTSFVIGKLWKKRSSMTTCSEESELIDNEQEYEKDLLERGATKLNSE